MPTRRSWLRSRARAARGAALAGPALSLLTACASLEAAARPTAGPTPIAAAPAGTLVLGATNEVATLNPFLSADVAVVPGLFEPLVATDPSSGAPVPHLAERWEQSADGLTYTFHLRPGVLWHDGQPFTADDAKFTYQAILDPKTATPRRNWYEQVASFDVADPLTLVITLKAPYCAFLQNSMQMAIVPKHLLGRSADLNSDAFNTARPVGTGPYRFVEWRHGDQLTLAANARYWGGPPAIGQVIRKVTPSSSVLVSQLRSGEVDVAMVDVTDLPDLAGRPDVTLSAVDALSYDGVGYNLANPLFADKRVRQALTCALDRDAMIRTVLHGEARPLDGPMPPASPYARADLPRYPFDPRRAAALLAAAGWQPGADGMLHRGGRPFAFALLTPAGRQKYSAAATVIQQQWKAVGVAAEIRTLDPNALTDVLRRHQFDAFIQHWGFSLDPSHRQLWHSSQIQSGFNYGAYRNATVDHLLDDGLAVPGCDEQRRRDIYGRLQAIIADEQPYTFLWSPKNLVAARARVRGVQLSPFTGGQGTFWNIDRWTLRP